jgi:hypothetical protein
MPSINDVYNQLLQVNSSLTSLTNATNNVQTAVDAVQTAVTQVNSTLSTGVGELVTIGNYTNQALYQNDQQNDTVICILEHISKNTCALLNQATTQTALQTAMAADIAGVEQMFATINPGAALELERLAALKAQIEQCCPPKKAVPPCDYAPCPAPRPIGQPPQVGGSSTQTQLSEAGRKTPGKRSGATK